MKLTLDLVSDVSCPWCIIGYKGLELALATLADDIEIELNWIPFEINPDMAAEGEELGRYLSRKYAMSAQQQQENNATIVERGQAVGFEFSPLEHRHIYNSLDCHRLLHLAKQQQLQTPLKLALFKAYFSDGIDISDIVKLTTIAINVGLPESKVKQLLVGDLYHQEVLQQQQLYRQRAVTSVPMLIVNDKYGINGAQTAAGYQEILNNIISEIQAG